MATCGEELTQITTLYDKQLVEMGKLRNQINDLEIACEVRRAIIYFLLNKLGWVYDDIPWKEIQDRLQ